MRAKERLDKLRSEVDAYLATGPCRIEDKVDGTTYSLHTFVDHMPNEEWVIDIAEVANLLRSVLDQLVWQLVLANGRDPSVLRTQFPIMVNHAAYAHGKNPPRDRFLEGVARKHRRVIDEYQPYQRARQAQRHPLLILNEVANSEKHRAGHAVLGTATECRARLSRPGEDEVMISFKRAMPLGDDVDMLKVTNQPNPAFPDLHARLELVDFSIDIGFTGGEEVVLLADIERALLMVFQVVDRCEAKL